MEAECNIAEKHHFLSSVELSELTCIIETILMVPHLVYIAVILRPMQSMMMMVGRLCMWDCMPMEVCVCVCHGII